MSERDRTRSTERAAQAKSAEATPESHVPRYRARVDTILPFCAGRLSWRHRARPSTTLHETQACPLGANLNVLCVSQPISRRKPVCSERRQNTPKLRWPMAQASGLLSSRKSARSPPAPTKETRSSDPAHPASSRPRPGSESQTPAPGRTATFLPALKP